MERFGLDGFEYKTPSVLSGGMRQRVAFMRTLMTDQELIVLDEPFGALDAFTRHQMQEWLVDIWGSMGKTIILITHDVDEALLLSDRVIVLTARGDVPAPFETDCAFYALLEFEALNEDVANEALATFEHCVEQGWVLDGVMSQSEQQLQNLWKLREFISETISHWTPYKNDISVTVGKVPGFLHDIDAIVAEHYPDFEIVWFGHIGDGNLHLNILKPESLSKDEFFARCATVNKWVFEIVQKYNGSISAEHGVGMTKRDYLSYSRSEAEIALMKAVKQVFDPNGIMNPGKIFP